MSLDPIISLGIADSEIKEKLEQLSKTCKNLADLRLVVGTNVSYMRKHQLGIQVPQRRFLGINDDDRIAILRILDEAIDSGEENAKLVYQDIGEYMLMSTDLRFKQEVDPDGNPWIPLTAFTLEKKRALGRIEKILQSTGIGRGSIRYQVF